MSQPSKKKNEKSVDGATVKKANGNTGKHSADEATRVKGIKIAAIISCAALVIGIAISLVFIFTRPVKIDYMVDDLSKYVYISPEKYTNFSVSADIRVPDASDTEFSVIKELTKHCERVGAGEYKYSGALGAADKVFIYYRGYLLDEDGKKNAFDGGCNFTDASPYELQLGSGNFVSGFEYHLIGKQIENYSKYEKITSGSVKQNQVVYISCARVDEDDKVKYYDNYRLDLSDPSVDELMGDGFSAALIGKDIGEELDPFDIKLDGKTLSYYFLNVEYATECEDNPITVEAYFPYNYTEQSLRGKTAYFDVYVQQYTDFNVPELNDTFITEKLKIESEALAEYEGEDLAAKYKNYVAQSLLDEYEANRASLIEDAVWTYLMNQTEIKKYPDEKVSRQYDIYYAELTDVYELYYTKTFKTFGEFVRAYYSLSASADWQDYIRLQAKAAVAQKMMFYYIIRQEGWLPEADEYERLYDEAVEAELENKLLEEGCERDDYTSDAAYEAAVAGIRRRLIADKGEAHFADVVYYDYGMKCILRGVSVK